VAPAIAESSLKYQPENALVLTLFRESGQRTVSATTYLSIRARLIGMLKHFLKRIIISYMKSSSISKAWWCALKTSLATRLCVSLSAGCAYSTFLYWLTTEYHSNVVTQRPSPYGTPVPLLRPGQAGVLLIGGEVAAPVHRVPMADSDDSLPVYAQNAVDFGPSLQRRRQFQGVDQQGNVRWKDFPRDNNSDNGPNRVYRYSTKYYKVPRCTLIGFIRERFYDLNSGRIPSLFGTIKFVSDHALVELPVDTVENLKKWWATVGPCEDNVDLSFVKANELTRNLALTAEDNNAVVLLSSLVALLSVKDSMNEFGLSNILDVMHNRVYFSNINENKYLYFEMMKFAPFRILLSAAGGSFVSLMTFIILTGYEHL
jgi:hypothetical protein